MSEDGPGKFSRKREDIVHAAEQLFLQKGIRPVTVEEIVQQAKVSKRTFYKYFSDKEAIVEQVLLTIINSMVNRITRMIEKAERDRLSEKDFLKLFDTNEYERLFQSGFTGELLRDYPELVLKLNSQWLGLAVPLFRRLIGMAQANGILRKDIDVDMLITYTIMIRRSYLEHLRLPEGMSLKAFTQKFYDMYLYGVVERKEPE
jgi:AcrR family transcriptional regulator